MVVKGNSILWGAVKSQLMKAEFQLKIKDLMMDLYQFKNLEKCRVMLQRAVSKDRMKIKLWKQQ